MNRTEFPRLVGVFQSYKSNPDYNFEEASSIDGIYIIPMFIEFQCGVDDEGGLYELKYRPDGRYFWNFLEGDGING